MQTSFKFLDTNDWKALKIIEIKGDSFFPFTAYFPYCRKMDTEYYKIFEKGDKLDNIILETIKKFYPNSFLSHNIHIYAVGQLNDVLKQIETGHNKEFIIQFSPEINYEIYNKITDGDIYSYSLNFEYRIGSLFANHENIKFLQNFYLCYIQNEHIKDYINTIIPI